MLGRAHAFALIAVLALGFASQAARADPALTYLESLKGSSERYKAPSELDGRYTVALYVNTADSGPWRQRMWVLHRDAIGGSWRLAMWDEEHWRKADLAAGEAPSYSWPVSTGRYYRGDPFSGPTPTGVFALDERKWRYGRGYTAPGHDPHHVYRLSLRQRPPVGRGLPRHAAGSLPAARLDRLARLHPHEAEECGVPFRPDHRPRPCAAGGDALG